jgi:hypothetical protein
MANRYFASTAPDRQDASIAVTAVELLRGDVPSVLRNFRQMQRRYRSYQTKLTLRGSKQVARAAGDEYLNFAFGWTPLVNELANVLKVGMTLERAVYYESFRRSRRWDGPSTSSVVQDLVSVSCTGLPYDSGSFTLPGEVPGGSTGYGGLFHHQVTTVESEDYHWSSRYTGLAKAGIRANSLSDQAADTLKRLGAVDDPRFLWDLTPWSWLVDWFTTMGDSISNARTYAPINGKYTADFAYLTTKRVRSVQGMITRPYAAVPSHWKLRLTKPSSGAISTTKWRDRATPFGFGTQLASLSGSQFAILTALGLARTR